MRNIEMALTGKGADIRELSPVHVCNTYTSLPIGA